MHFDFLRNSSSRDFTNRKIRRTLAMLTVEPFLLLRGKKIANLLPRIRRSLGHAGNFRMIRFTSAWNPLGSSHNGMTMNSRFTRADLPFDKSHLVKSFDLIVKFQVLGKGHDLF